MSEILAHGEQVHLVVRRHWIAMLGGILPGIFIAVLVLVFRNILLTSTIQTPSGDLALPTLPPEYINGATAILLLIITMYIFHAFADYYLDTWVITNRRIIGILQRGFFSREVNSFRLERFQNVQTDIHGFIPTIFNYGEVHIETAGHHHEVVMYTVPNPKKIRDLLMKFVAEVHERGTDRLQDGPKTIE